MIRINLAKKRKPSGGGLDLKNLNMTSLLELLKGGGGGDDGEQKKLLDPNNPLVKVLLGMLAIYFVDDTLIGYREESLKKVEAQVAVVEKERDAVLAKLNKVRGFEPVKKQLEEDERAVRTKLEVVSRLLENRNLPSKLLMQIAQVIPNEVYLTELRVNARSVRLAGATPGHSQVSDFIKGLSNTNHFAEVTLRGIRESSNDAGNRNFQTFELDAQRR